MTHAKKPNSNSNKHKSSPTLKKSRLTYRSMHIAKSLKKAQGFIEKTYTKLLNTISANFKDTPSTSSQKSKHQNSSNPQTSSIHRKHKPSIINKLNTFYTVETSRYLSRYTNNQRPTNLPPKKHQTHRPTGQTIKVHPVRHASHALPQHVKQCPKQSVVLKRKTINTIPQTSGVGQRQMQTLIRTTQAYRFSRI